MLGGNKNKIDILIEKYVPKITINTAREIIQTFQIFFPLAPLSTGTNDLLNALSHPVEAFHFSEKQLIPFSDLPDVTLRYVRFL